MTCLKLFILLPLSNTFFQKSVQTFTADMFLSLSLQLITVSPLTLILDHQFGLLHFGPNVDLEAFLWEPLDF